jgi:hypothetical protein
MKGGNHTSTLQIDRLGPDKASSCCYDRVLAGGGLDHWGRYLDDHGVVDGTWYFVHRRVLLDGTLPNSWVEYARTQQ